VALVSEPLDFVVDPESDFELVLLDELEELESAELEEEEVLLELEEELDDSELLFTLLDFESRLSLR